MKLIHAALATTLFSISGSLFAAERAIDPAKSTISAVFTQIGVPVEAPFTKFTGRVDHDPAKPADAKAVLDIDTASFDIGDDDYNAEVRKPEWFDTAKYPKATFTATGLTPAANGSFTAAGKLSLKGRTAELKVPVTVKADAAGSSYSGKLIISRKAFSIGDPAWEDTVEDTVTIQFRIFVPAAR
ncbi:YceI family protein [Nevskia sp.]|uniref:YceI family protein n=1 Tax=Nevskia sp. TaxID=1929292 RepID=UPI0025D94CF1|nr:YceI family protein [Nevskia sp.]